MNKGAGSLTMIEYLRKRIENKSILILGFGREGKSTLKVLSEAGSFLKIAIGDQKELSLESEVFSSEEFSNCDLSKLEFCCGANYQDYIDQFDIVMKSPGIVLNKDIAEYKAEILSEMQLFFEFYRDQIIGITGTKGKSTTTTLLHHILKESGRPAILAGNIGIPVFDIIHDITKDSILVIELSCHQLEYVTVSPKWAILLNIYEEHLDHYGTMEKYVASKEKIYVNQKEGDILFVNPEIMPREGMHRGCAKTVDINNVNANVYLQTPTEAETEKSPIMVYRDLDRICAIPVRNISLLGDHNYLDVTYVYAMCCEFGVTDREFVDAIQSYVPLPHRLQFIGEEAGVAYYDDSISTIDETTIQALNTIKNADTVIIGGMDREISYVTLEEYLSTSRVPHIILMEATGRRIFEEIKAKYPDFANSGRLLLVEHLEDAVSLAKQITKKGGSCILSPAAASYGIFKNFEERGDVFAKLVHSNQETAD